MCLSGRDSERDSGEWESESDKGTKIERKEEKDGEAERDRVRMGREIENVRGRNVFWNDLQKMSILSLSKFETSFSSPRVSGKSAALNLFFIPQKIHWDTLVSESAKLLTLSNFKM